MECMECMDEDLMSDDIIGARVTRTVCVCWGGVCVCVSVRALRPPIGVYRVHGVHSMCMGCMECMYADVMSDDIIGTARVSFARVRTDVCACTAAGCMPAVRQMYGRCLCVYGCRLYAGCAGCTAVWLSVWHASCMPAVCRLYSCRRHASHRYKDQPPTHPHPRPHHRFALAETRTRERQSSIRRPTNRRAFSTPSCRCRGPRARPQRPPPQVGCIQTVAQLPGEGPWVLKGC